MTKRTWDSCSVEIIFFVPSLFCQKKNIQRTTKFNHLWDSFYLFFLFLKRRLFDCEMKKFSFFFLLFFDWIFFVWTMKNSCISLPFVFLKKTQIISRVVSLSKIRTLYESAWGGVKRFSSKLLFFSRFYYNRIKRLSLSSFRTEERKTERNKERTLLLLKRFLRFCLAKTKQNDNVDKQQRKRHSEIGVWWCKDDDETDDDFTTRLPGGKIIEHCVDVVFLLFLFILLRSQSVF